MRHICGEIIDQRLPAGQHRLAHDLSARHAPGRRGDRLERGGGILAHALDPLERLGISVHHPGKAPELGQQRFGHRLGVAARNGGEQEVFEHLVIGQRLGPAGQQPGAQPRAVAIASRLARVPIGHRAIEKIETVFSFRQCDLRKSVAHACLIAFTG